MRTLLIIALMGIANPVFSGDKYYKKGTIFHIYVSTDDTEHSRMYIIEKDSIKVGYGFNDWINELKDTSIMHEQALPKHFVIKDINIITPN